MSLARERNPSASLLARDAICAWLLTHYARLRLACSLTLRPLSLTLMQTLSRASDRAPSLPVDSFKVKCCKPKLNWYQTFLSTTD
jgi:hypothetical protein